VHDTRETRRLLRALGARELASGIGILTGDRRSAWLWSRVAGDMMDLALLGVAFGGDDVQRRSLAAATAAVAGVTALDVMAGRSRGARQAKRHIERVFHSMTVNGSPDEVYRFWRDLENLPRFMRNLESVTASGNRSSWVARGPGGIAAEWDAEIVSDRPGEEIAWRSLPGSRISNSGRVRFRGAPGSRGTEVGVEMSYHIPAGRVGSTAAWLFGVHPDQQLREDMRRFKQVFETGEIARSDASEGFMGMRPGQPHKAKSYEEFARGER
jgi:uncharacterized membrane protein